MVRVPYVCGPLTELPSDRWYLLRVLRSVVNFFSLLVLARRLLVFWTAQEAKAFYVAIADSVALWEMNPELRPFVPHEHYDPVRHAQFTPTDVDAAERKQVCEGTSVLVVIPVAPSWGGGIEVEMANRSGVSVVVLHPCGKRVSRLLRGNPAVSRVMTFTDQEDALVQLRNFLASPARSQPVSVA